jgi:hypothetical protein
MVAGDLTLRDIEAEHADMKVECFLGIKTEHFHRVKEKRDLGSPETVIIHVGTNQLRTTKNLDSVMGEVHVYAFVATAKRELPKCRLVLSEVLRRRDVSWRRNGAQNDRYDWLENALRLNSVDPNSWIQDGYFVRDGLHLNRRGQR